MLIDTQLFGPDAVSDETVAFRDALIDQMAALPDPEVLDDAEQWGLFWTPEETYVSEIASDDVIPGPRGRDLSIRIYAEGDIRGVMLHFHPGGWVFGHPRDFDVTSELLARSASLAVVSVDYALAPEHPWPAALDDAIAAVEWLRSEALQRFGTERLLIGGESAGASLAVAAILRSRDSAGFSAWSGAILNYGGYDLRPTRSRRTIDTDPILTPALFRWSTAQLLGPGHTHDDLADPELSPVLADLHEFPPTILTIGTLDPFIDENLHFAVRLQAANVDTTLAIAPGGFHAFDAFPIDLADQARSRIADWVADLEA